MSMNFIIERNKSGNATIIFKVLGTCMIVPATPEGRTEVHIPLDLRDLTLLQAEIEDIIFDLQEGAFDETDPDA